MVCWRSWLACRPVTAEVAGSSPVQTACSFISYAFLSSVEDERKETGRWLRSSLSDACRLASLGVFILVGWLDI